MGKLRERAWSLVGALVCGIVGAVLLAAGWSGHIKQQPFADGVTTDAKVTDVSVGVDRKGRAQHSRVITFRSTTGRSVTITEDASDSRPPELGATVQVSYQPSNPESARILAGRNGWDLMAVGLVGVGAVLVLVSLGTLMIRLTVFAAGVVLFVTANRKRQGAGDHRAAPGHLR